MGRPQRHTRHTRHTRPQRRTRRTRHTRHRWCSDGAAPLDGREREQHEIEREDERETRLELEDETGGGEHVADDLVEVGVVGVEGLGDARQPG